MLRLLAAMGVRRGLLGTSRAWLAVLLGVTGVRLLGRVMGRQPRVVYRETLEPGPTLVITRGSPVAELAPQDDSSSRG